MVEEDKKWMTEYFSGIVITPDQYFHTADNKILRNISEYLSYIKNCDDNIYTQHVNASKNDFASWVEGVFKLTELSKIIRDAKNVNENIRTTEKYVSDIIEVERRTQLQKPADSPNIKPSDASSEILLREEVKVELSKKVPKTESVVTISNKVDVNEKPIEEKPILKQESSVESKISVGPKNSVTANSTTNGLGMHEFGDEELDKFVKFVKKEKDVDTNPRLDSMNAAVVELKQQITDLRKQQRNPIVPDLLLRMIAPKIAYFTISRSESDYANVMNLLSEVRTEIEYCKQEKLVNVKEELMSAMEKNAERGP